MIIKPTPRLSHLIAANNSRANGQNQRQFTRSQLPNLFSSNSYEGEANPPFDSAICVRRILPFSPEHVDILSHQDVLRDVLLIAAGRSKQIGDRVVSNIDDIATNIAL